MNDARLSRNTRFRKKTFNFDEVLFWYYVTRMYINMCMYKLTVLCHFVIHNWSCLLHVNGKCSHWEIQCSAISLLWQLQCSIGTTMVLCTSHKQNGWTESISKVKASRVWLTQEFLLLLRRRYKLQVFTRHAQPIQFYVHTLVNIINTMIDMLAFTASIHVDQYLICDILSRMLACPVPNDRKALCSRVSCSVFPFSGSFGFYVSKFSEVISNITFYCVRV